MAIAMVTAGKMRNIWASAHIPLKLKLRIYKVGVCTKLTYGSEAWTLDSKAIQILNGANSRMLSRITGKTIREEASANTRTYDVVEAIRARRMKWVGHILRMDAERIVHKVLHFMHENQADGDLLMDVPSIPWTSLKSLAADRQLWRKHVRANFVTLWPRVVEQFCQILNLIDYGCLGV